MGRFRRHLLINAFVCTLIAQAPGAVALADTDFFAPPPDPAALSPVQLPVEAQVPVETLSRQIVNARRVSVSNANAGVLNATFNPAVDLDPNFVQQCAAQTDPANFPTFTSPPTEAGQPTSILAAGQPAKLPAHIDATAEPIRQSAPPAPDSVSTPNQSSPSCNQTAAPSCSQTSSPSCSQTSNPSCSQASPTCSSTSNSCSNSCSSTCNQNGNNCCDGCCNDCCRRDWWVDVDYLAMWIQANHLPPLVTTSPAGTPQGSAGVLPGATILFGNNFVNGGARNGGRVTLGYWLDDNHDYAIEASWFTVTQPTGAANFFANSTTPGGRILARPFTSGGIPNAQLAAFPGLVTGQPQTPGTIGVTTTTDMDFGDIIIDQVISRDDSTQICFTYGYRHLEFRENLRIFENLLTLPAPSTALNLVDQFQVTNDFQGALLGTQFLRTSGAWSLKGVANLGFGNMHESVNISGNTTVTDPLGNVTHQPGLLAQPSNDGIHSQNVFAFLPELELYLHYQLTNQIDLSVGYTFLCITRVARVGDQLDTNVSNTQLPTAGPTSGVGNQPTEVLRDTSLWAQGISGGIELRF